VSLNNQAIRPATLVIDTGSSHTILSTKLLQAICRLCSKPTMPAKDRGGWEGPRDEGHDETGGHGVARPW